MQSTRSCTNREDDFGFFTRMLADLCHNCGTCRYTARRSGSPFSRFMGWRRNWCPAWAAHSRVYGDEPLDEDDYDDYDDTRYSRTACDCYDDWE
jgi:hypothetical protein